MDHYGRYAVANQYYGGSYHFDHHGYGYGIGFGHGYQYLRGHCRDGDRDDSDAGCWQYFGGSECMCQQRYAPYDDYFSGSFWGIGQLYLPVGEQYGWGIKLVIAHRRCHGSVTII
jgi:hypothetical protein